MKRSTKQLDLVKWSQDQKKTQKENPKPQADTLANSIWPEQNKDDVGDKETVIFQILGNIEETV